MSNLLASLGESASALQVFQRALTTVQSNVSNASTPGYARQSQVLEAAALDPANGLMGGVRDGGTQSARSDYAEQAVRVQSNAFGMSDEMATALAQLSSLFDVSGETGVPGALNQLYQKFSAWSVTPNDPAARQAVLDSAAKVAQAFVTTSNQISQSRTQVDRDISTTVGQINEIAKNIQKYNEEIRRGSTNAGLDAQLYSSLEDLSQYVDVTVIKESDGTATVLLGGQIPLVMGHADQPVTLTAAPASVAAPAYAGATPPTHVYAGDEDLDGVISQGRLGGLLKVRNETIPSLIGDPMTEGKLNQMAAGFADRVNTLLAGGVKADGVTPGDPLFVFDDTGAIVPPNLDTAASTIRVNPALLPADLAAIQPTDGTLPTVANGVALALAGLATPSSDLDRLDGLSYTQYYAAMGTAIGNDARNAKQQRDSQTQLVAQAQSLRQQIQGVSLDQEAAILIQFQRSYQATARLVSVLNDLTETAVNLGRQ